MNATNLFLALLFGHFVGDFFLQPKSMAVKKGASNLIAVTHVAIYTLAVLLFSLPFIGLPKNPSDLSWLWHYYAWVAIIFVPHFVIDRFSLADRWLDLINGRSLRDFMAHGQDDIPENMPHANYHALRAGFTCIVYVVVDNVSHLMCLWYGFNFLFGNQLT